MKHTDAELERRVAELHALLEEARETIASWYYDATGHPAEELEVVRKIDAVLKLRSIG